MTVTSDPRHHRPGHCESRPVHPPRLRELPPPTARPGQPASAAGQDLAELVAGDRLTLSVGEAGALLGISRALAYELVTRGELPSVRLGRRVVVPKVALLELLGLRPRAEA